MVVKKKTAKELFNIQDSPFEKAMNAQSVAPTIDQRQSKPTLPAPIEKGKSGTRVSEFVTEGKQFAIPEREMRQLASKNEIAQFEAEKNRKLSEQAQQDLIAKQKQNQISEQFQQNVSERGVEGQFDVRDRLPEFATNVLSGTAQVLERGTAILPSWLNLASSKSVPVIQAEQRFTDMSAIIDNDINLYKQGLKSMSEVQRDFDLAISSTTDLYQETKGKGQTNLRFWLDEGKEIEAQVNKQLRILENQKAVFDAISVGVPIA